MKRQLVILFSLLCAMSMLVAQDFGSKKTEKRTPVETVAAFKKVLSTNDWARAEDIFSEMRLLDSDVLTANKIFEKLMEVIKSKDSNVYFKRDSIELILYFKKSGKKITNLESDLINVMLDKETGWYVQNLIINQLPEVIDPSDNFNRDKMLDAMVKIIEYNPTISDKGRYIDVKRTAFTKLNAIGINYSKVKKIVLKELKDKNSELKDAVIQFLLDYSNKDSTFADYDIKAYIRNAITSNKGDYSPMQLASAIQIYANILVNEKSKIQKSDEKMFIEFLQAAETPVIVAAARSLYTIKSTDAVEPILNRLRELQSNEYVRNELVVALVYLEDALLKSPELSKSRREEAIKKIKDVFILSLQQPTVKGPIRYLIYKGIDLFGIEHSAGEFVKLDDLKALVGIMSELKDEKELLRLAEILSNLTSQYYGVNVLSWEQWTVEEEKNSRSPFNR